MPKFCLTGNRKKSLSSIFSLGIFQNQNDSQLAPLAPKHYYLWKTHKTFFWNELIWRGHGNEIGYKLTGNRFYNVQKAATAPVELVMSSHAQWDGASQLVLFLILSRYKEKFYPLLSLTYLPAWYFQVQEGPAKQSKIIKGRIQMPVLLTHLESTNYSNLLVSYAFILIFWETGYRGASRAE